MCDGSSVSENYLECPYEHRHFTTQYRYFMTGQIQEVTPESDMTLDWFLSDLSLRLLFLTPDKLYDFAPYGKNLYRKAILIGGHRFTCSVLVTTPTIQVEYKQVEESIVEDNKLVTDQLYRITFTPVNSKLDFEFDEDPDVYVEGTSRIWGLLQKANHITESGNELVDIISFQRFRNSSDTHHIVFMYEGELDNLYLETQFEKYPVTQVGDFLYEADCPIDRSLTVKR